MSLIAHFFHAPVEDKIVEMEDMVVQVVQE
jgi:hypothetical protein